MMYKFLALALASVSMLSQAQLQLVCATEKFEIDPGDFSYGVGFDAQTFALPLDENREPRGSAHLSYKFEENTAEPGQWALLVQGARLQADTVSLDVQVQKAGQIFQEQSVELKLYDAGKIQPRTKAFFVNAKISPIAGKTFLHDDALTTDVDVALAQPIKDGIANKSLLRGDLAFLVIGNCRIEQIED